MLPTFVIGLREGLEAALIVGIIAAFLRKQGRTDLLRVVWIGVATAFLLCLGAGLLLQHFQSALPQRQQEGLEAVIGLAAVLMVTYMVIWMRRHSRELKSQLEGLAGAAIGSGAGSRAMVLMAFLAVIREGFESVVFFLAAFNQPGVGAEAGIGAGAGIAVAAILGFGIYRGGVRLNLSKFFRATGVVLVFVAGGLIVNSLRDAHEAGWLNFGQGQILDLSWLVEPGSVRASLLTGMLGVQPRPVTVEVSVWLVYVVPVAAYVLWPAGRRIGARRLLAVTATVAAIAGIGAAALFAAAPAAPRQDDQVQSAATGSAVLTLDGRAVRLAAAGSARSAGIDTSVYRGTVQTGSADARLTVAQVARANGGRLPIGVKRASNGTYDGKYVDRATLTAAVEPRTERLVSLTRRQSRFVVLQVAGTPLTLPTAVTTTTSRTANDAAGIRNAVDDQAARQTARAYATSLAALAALAAAIALGCVVVRRRHRQQPPTPTAHPNHELLPATS